MMVKTTDWSQTALSSNLNLQLCDLGQATLPLNSKMGIIVPSAKVYEFKELKFLSLLEEGLAGRKHYVSIT